MTRKRGQPKPNTKPDVVGRVAGVLVECPLTHSEILWLERIEARRQEADSDMRHALTPEQRQKAYAKAAKAGDDSIALARQVASRAEDHWSAAVLKEVSALADLRGEDLDETSTGARQRPSPLLRLHRARLISDEQFAAGSRYAACWQRLYWSAKGNGTGSSLVDPLDSRMTDLKRLDEARGYSIPEGGTGKVLVVSGLGGDARLIKLVDDICGAEKSLREAIGSDTRKRRRVFPMFKQALGMLAIHYGLTKTREDELRAA